VSTRVVPVAELLGLSEYIEPVELSEYELEKAAARGFTADDLQRAHVRVIENGWKASDMATRLVSAVAMRAESRLHG
jgi:hypothetical protein